jgi:hypothetical protein
MSWYAKDTSSSQGLVIDEADGRTVAVAYDPKDTPLLAAAPKLLNVAERIYAIWSDLNRSPSELADSVDIGWIRDIITEAKGEA